MHKIWSVDSKENLYNCCHQMSSFKAKMHQFDFVTTVISQGSVATRLRCGGQCDISLFQISWWIQQWKNFENPSTSDKVMGKSI